MCEHELWLFLQLQQYLMATTTPEIVQPSSPKSNDTNDSSDFVSVLANVITDGVGETVAELADITTAFGDAKEYDFPEETSDEFDWDQINVRFQVSAITAT